MTVYDRWHKSYPKEGDALCREHRQVPTADHGQGERWQVRWRDDAGRQRKKNFAKKTGNDPNTCAEAFDAKTKHDLDHGSYIDPNAGKITLESYGRQWESSLTVDPLTIMQIRSRLKVHVYPKIGHHEMGVLAKRPSRVQQWIKSLEPELLASTIKGVVGLVSAIFNAAADDGIVHRNPCTTRSVRPPRPAAKKVMPWDLAQVGMVAEALPDRLEAMVYLGAGCGHRQGELFGVALEDVDFLGRVVHVVRQIRIVDSCLVFSRPKGDKIRHVPLPETIALRLSAHVQQWPPVCVTLPWRKPSGEPVTAELLFVTAQCGPLERNSFNRLWRTARTRAGMLNIRDNGMHVLRHTAASAWLAAGVDIRTVAEYLGHTDPGFTLRVYSHLMPDAADRARRAMDAFFRDVDVTASALDVPSQ